jgi:hypothetical protein
MTRSWDFGSGLLEYSRAVDFSHRSLFLKTLRGRLASHSLISLSSQAVFIPTLNDSGNSPRLIHFHKVGKLWPTRRVTSGLKSIRGCGCSSPALGTATGRIGARRGGGGLRALLAERRVEVCCVTG